MDARMRLAVGGVATVAASIAVVCAVAVTNAAALADSAGAPVAVSGVEVPAAAPSVVAPSPSPTPTAAAVVAPPAGPAETVPAPAPQDVTSDSKPADPVAETPAPATATPDAAGQDPIAVAPGGWDQLIQWAHSQGWSDADIAGWVASHQDLIAELESRWKAAQTPAQGAGSSSDSAWRDGSKKNQPPSSPDWRG